MHQRALAALDIFADVEVAFLDQPPRLDHVLAHDDAWVARRIDIARHWLELHPHD